MCSNEAIMGKIWKCGARGFTTKCSYEENKLHKNGINEVCTRDFFQEGIDNMFLLLTLTKISVLNKSSAWKQ